MSNLSQDRQISLEDFTRLLKKLKKTKIDTVKLLGGEPLIHSQIKEIVTLSLAHFPKVQIFTNGIMTGDLALFITKHVPRVQFTFNVVTPGFQLNPQIRKLVIEKILQFAPLTDVTLSLTIDPFTDLELVYRTVTPEVLRAVKSLRIGFSNPTVGERNYYLFEDFPKMGTKLAEFTKEVKKHNPTLHFHLNCGFTRCMFTDKEYAYLLKERVLFGGFGCIGKHSSMDIGTDSRAFHCFPLSEQTKVSVKDKSYQKVDSALILKRYSYWSKIQMDVCKKCPFHGFAADKCPGPCLAFLLNRATV